MEDKETIKALVCFSMATVQISNDKNSRSNNVIYTKISACLVRSREKREDFVAPILITSENCDQNQNSKFSVLARISTSI